MVNGSHKELIGTMNKDEKNNAKEKTNEEFTGSPEHQFPDFEAEDLRDQQNEQDTKPSGSKKNKDQMNN